MTNLEWLKSLSAEGIADLFEKKCLTCEYDRKSTCFRKGSNCRQGRIEWLKAEHVPKLKPCPCCGGEAVIDDNDMGVYCNDCGMGTTWGATIEDAIKTWNRRVDNE